MTKIDRKKKLEIAYDLCVQAFGLDGGISWMTEKNESLGNQRPLDMIDTDRGLDLVLTELRNKADTLGAS